MRKQIMFGLSLLLIQQLHAQDSLKTTTLQEVVISGTKFEVPIEKSGKIVFKISGKDLERNAGRSVSDVLNRVPGIQMDGNFSSPGANTSYFIRGGRNRHTLVMLDGVPLIDPSGIEQFYDLRFMSLDQLESIEVLQGSLSTLYGSGAAAGVINLQSKKATEDGVHGSLTAGAGSWNTFNQSLNVNGKFNRTSFTLMGGNYTSQGFSAAQDNDPTTKFDKDGLEKRNLFLRIAHDFSPDFSLSLYTSYDWFKNEFDSWAFMDGNESQLYKQFRVGLKSSYRYANGEINGLLQTGVINRNEKTAFAAKYDGVTTYGEINNRHQFTKNITTLTGVTFQKLSYGEENVNEQDTTSFTIVDPYTSILVELDNGLSIHAGLRLNTHSVYGNKVVYNFNPSWTVSLSDNFKTKFLASVSTAYITPSLFQLYTTWGGNRNLKPEEDFNAEYGATFYLKNRFEFTVVNYYRKEENSIAYSPSFQYINTNQNRYVDGVTLNAKWNLSNKLKLSADYAYTHTNLSKSFYRIPTHKAGASVMYQPKQGSTLVINYMFTGKRTDFNYPDEIKLDSYSIVDIIASQKFLKDRLSAYVTVSNVFDEKFIAVYGYTTRGRNFSAGVKFNF